MTQPPTSSSAPASWAAADHALRAIQTGKGDLNALLQLVRSLLELGMGSLAERLLGAVNIPSPQWESQRGQILKQLQSLRPCAIPWKNREQIFQENVEAIFGQIHVQQALKAFWREHQSRYQLLLASDGNFQVVDRQSTSILTGFMGGLSDHRALAEQWKQKATQTQSPIAFDGAGYGWVLQRVLESTNQTFLQYSTAIYVFEPDLASACILLNLHDLRKWRERIRFFVGSDCVAEFERGVEQNEHWLLPTVTVTDRLINRPAVDARGPVMAVAQARKQRSDSLNARIDAHYAPLTINDWAARYQEATSGGRPLRVLGITSRFTTVLQYSMDELGEAIRASGHEFILCKEPDDQSLWMPQQERIAELKPDLLVLISRMRYEFLNMPKNVPFLCWDQDHLPWMRTPEAGKSLDELTYVAGVGASFGYEHLNWRRGSCILVGQAAATHRYKNSPADAGMVEKHRCTFSYTSNASESPETLAQQMRRSFASDAAALKLFDEAAKQVLARAKMGFAWDTVETAKLVEERQRASGTLLAAGLRHEMIINLRRVSDRAFRHVALEWVADYCRRKGATLRLYGKGWESSPRFAEFAAGFLAPGEEMRAVFQASRINLQIIENGFIHSRALDGLAAGGFFLYRYAPESRITDGQAEARLAMARRAVETGCLTFGQLDASRDPLIADQWAFCRTVIPLGTPDEICRMLDLWIAAPPEDIQIPLLKEITFGNKEEFVAMADRFLSDEQMRQDVTSRLRDWVVERFSYDARWREFLAAISSGLRQTAQPLARAA